jgi:aminopeptidase N
VTGPHRRQLAAVALVATLVAGSCSAHGASDRADRPGGTTTTEGRTTTTDAGPRTPGPDDVPDDTFPGLGDPRIDVSSYDVEVTAAPGEEAIEGSVAITLRVKGKAPIDSFTLDLRGPAIDRAEVDGADATVSAQGAEVTLTPAEPLPPGRDIDVSIDYSGVPDQDTFPALGVPVGWQRDDSGGWFTMSEPNGTSTWVPCNDHPIDKASWRVTLVVPKGVVGLSNGKLQGNGPTHDGDQDRWTWQEVEPMAPYLVFAAVGDYDLVQRPVGEDAADGVFAYPPDLPESKRAGFDPTGDILDFYGGLFGAYPDDDAGAIVVDSSLGLALEVQTRPLFGLDGVENGTTWALAHELAHQWFGDAVSPANWRDLWLNEGFATYADWLWLDHEGDYPLEQSVADAVDHYADVGLTVRDPTATRTFDMVVYDRGALTLQAFRLEVGDDAFFRTMRAWVRRWKGRSATTGDFVALASEVAGRDLTDLFASWLDRTPQPKLPS